MHAYSCELVHSVTLIAQPRSKTPFVKVGAMKTGKFEPRKSGTFGIMWFTDFGDKFWEACQGVDFSCLIVTLLHHFQNMELQHIQ